MAARTSAGVGVGVTVTILGVLSLALFILTIVYLSRSQRAEADLAKLQQDTEVFVKSSEAQRDDVRRLKDAAQRERKSVIGYLSDSMRTSMQRVTGSGGDTFEQLIAKLDAIPDAKGNALLAVLRTRDGTIERLTREGAQADQDRTTALTNLANESDRVQRLQQGHQQTIAALNGDIDRYKSEVDSYRESVNDAKREMDERVGRIQQRADGERALLTQQIDDLKRQNLIQTETIAKLRTTNKDALLKPQDEAALVDGVVVGVNPAENEVFIGIGEQEKVVLGMTFAVYTDAKAIRPDPNSGEYPRGKATLEVINVGRDSSTCRVTSEVRGNPIVKGDAVANAVYDPRKVYKFVVYGNFDADSDGRASELEASQIKSVIAAWGGQTVDDLIGDVDFLILGSKPGLPPVPPSTAPIEVVLEYQRLVEKATRYDDLLRQANATSVPVLNQNRLYTLTGRRR